VTHDWKTRDIRRQPRMTKHSCPDLWISNVHCQVRRNEVWVGQVIVVEENDDWAARCENAQVLCLSKPAVPLPKYLKWQAIGVAA
jgi:hypothetical protein